MVFLNGALVEKKWDEERKREKDAAKTRRNKGTSSSCSRSPWQQAERPLAEMMSERVPVKKKRKKPQNDLKRDKRLCRSEVLISVLIAASPTLFLLFPPSLALFTCLYLPPSSYFYPNSHSLQSISTNESNCKVKYAISGSLLG